MQKKERHQIIKNIISSGLVGTQEEIKEQLENQGILVTQATLSRDLREIGLLKIRHEDGKLYYSLADVPSSQFTESIKTHIRDLSRIEFMLVIKTDLGEADVLANLVDGENRVGILGTIAGADTLLVICQSAQFANQLEEELTR